MLKGALKKLSDIEGLAETLGSGANTLEGLEEVLKDYPVAIRVVKVLIITLRVTLPVLLAIITLGISLIYKLYKYFSREKLTDEEIEKMVGDYLNQNQDQLIPNVIIQLPKEEENEELAALESTEHSTLWYIGVTIITFGLYWLFREKPSQQAKPAEISKPLKAIKELTDKIELAKKTLTRQDLESLFNDYFSDSFTPEIIDSFFNGNVEPYEAVIRAIDHLVRNSNKINEPYYLANLAFISFNISADTTGHNENYWDFLQSMDNLIDTLDSFMQTSTNEEEKSKARTLLPELLRKELALEQKVILSTQDRTILLRENERLTNYKSRWANVIAQFNRNKTESGFEMVMIVADMYIATSYLAKKMPEEYNLSKVRDNAESVMVYLSNIPKSVQLPNDLLDKLNERIHVLLNISSQSYYIDNNRELLNIVGDKTKSIYDRLLALTKLREKKVEVTQNMIDDLQDSAAASTHDTIKIENIKKTVEKILVKLNAFGQISNEEMVYLEAIKNSTFYKGEALASAIKLCLEADISMPTDFANKILKKEDLNILTDYFISFRKNLLDNPPSFSVSDTKLLAQAKDFKHKVTIADKALASLFSVDELRRNFSNFRYFFVTKYSKDENMLKAILKKDGLATEYRLYAYGYLKTMGIDSEDNYVQSPEFNEKIKSMLNGKSLKVDTNYFDLRACELGINIVINKEMRNKINIRDYKLSAYNYVNRQTYESIMGSNFVNFEDNTAYSGSNANSALTFTYELKKKGMNVYDQMYRTVAHELGHRQLHALGVDSGTMSSGMFHEFFADIVAGTVLSKFLNKSVNFILTGYTSARKAFTVFSRNRKKESSAQEVHDAARGLINIVKTAFDHIGEAVSYDTILNVSIQVANEIRGGQSLEQGQQENLAKKVVATVALAVADAAVGEVAKGEFIYQFIKEEGAKFTNIEEELEIFGDDARGKELLHYYLVAKHSHESRPRFIGKDLYDAEEVFIRGYSPTTVVQNATRVLPGAQTWQPLLAPSFENSVLYTNESETKSSSVVLKYIVFTIITLGFYWLFRLISFFITASTKKEIDGSIETIEEVLNASMTNVIMQDNVLDDLIEELEENLTFVKNRHAGDRQESIEAGKLLLADIENLFNLITNLKTNTNFTQGQKLAIARVIARSWALVKDTDAMRMAKVVDSNDDRQVSASMTQNGVTDKAVLDALNSYFNNTSNLTSLQIADLAHNANNSVINPNEYTPFGIKEYDDTFAQEENSGRFGPNTIDIREIAKRIQLLHLLQPNIEITADVLRQIGVVEGLDTILARAMSRVKFSKTTTRQLNQTEQEMLLTDLPLQIQNLEMMLKEKPNDKQAAKNLNNAQSNLDDMIFANQNIPIDIKQIVDNLRNITQQVIDKGSVDQQTLDQIKSFVMQCKSMILASDSNLNENSFGMMFKIPLEVLQTNLNNGDINGFIGLASQLLDTTLIKLSKIKNFSVTGINKFLQTENNEEVNPHFVDGDGNISNLYIALTLSRLVTVLDTIASANATSINDLEPSLGTRSRTTVLLERLRYGLKPGSISKEFARVDLVSAFRNYIDRYEEVLAATQEQSSTRVNQTLLDADKGLVVAQSDYRQQQPSAELNLGVPATQTTPMPSVDHTPLAPAMQESIASARFTSIRAGILAFLNTAGFTSLVVLLSLSVITGLGFVIASSIAASVIAIMSTLSIMSSIYERNQKKVIEELGKSNEIPLSPQESRLVFAKLVRSLPKETAIKLVKATFNNNTTLANEYLNIISGLDWQNDIETNNDIINALNAAIINNNSVVMETTDTGRISFSPYIVRSLLSNLTMLRVVVEHELHHLEYANATSGTKKWIHNNLPALEEFIVSFGNVFRWFRVKVQEQWRVIKGAIPIAWNLPEGLALGDILVNKVNEQGFIDAPNIQTGHVQLANGRRGTLTYKVTRNGIEVPNFEFGKTKFNPTDIGSIEITYTFMPDTYTLSFATNDALDTPAQKEIKNGEFLKIEAVTSLPQRVGYKFNGYKYVNIDGKVRTITNQEVLDGFDIPSSDITGDLKLQALWIAEASDVVFVDKDGTISTVAGAAVNGQNVRVKGWGMFNGVKRLFNAMRGARTGIKVQKITWNIPSEISAPEGLPKEIDNGVALNAPLIAEGRVQLKDGRFGTVKCIVKIDGEVVENFQFGTTPINGDLSIEYTFTPENYSINFTANGATENVPTVQTNVLSDGQIYHVNGVSIEQLPKRDGDLFKGYAYTTRDGRIVYISRIEVINGFNIDGTDITGDIELVCQWEKGIQAEQYEVEFSNISLNSVASNLENKSATFGEAYTIDHNIIKQNVDNLSADNWSVVGYIVSVNGIDIMKVDIDPNNISDVTVPAQDVVGKLTIRFLRNPKVTFENEFAQNEADRKKFETMQPGHQFTFEQLSQKAVAEYDTNGVIGHWSRSDSKNLTAPIMEPITFTYSERFYNIKDFEGGNWPTNIFALLCKLIASIVKKIYNAIVTPGINKLSILKNTFKGLNAADIVKIIFSMTIMVGMIALLVLVSAPGIFGLLIIAALIIAIVNVTTILVGPIAKGVLKTLRDKASTEQKIERYDYYLEVLDMVLNVSSKASSSKTISYVRVAMYVISIAVLVLGILAIPSVGVLVIAASWAVPFAGAVFGLLMIGLVGFMIYKYKSSAVFKTVIDIVGKFFKNSNWKFKLNIMLGVLISIGALTTFFIAPIAVGFSFLILLGAIVMFAVLVVLFFTYNRIELYQTSRNVLLENLAGEGQPNAERIKRIIANYDESKYGGIAKEAFGLLVEVVGIKELLILTGKGVINGTIAGIRGLANALVNPLTYKVIYMVGKGLHIHHNEIQWVTEEGIQWVTKKVAKWKWVTKVLQYYNDYIYTSVTNAAQRTQNAVVSVVNYTANFYDGMTGVIPSLNNIPTREGFEFDGYEITSKNSDITTTITAEQANSDFAIPAAMVNGKVSIRIRWKPNVSITTGNGTRKKLGFSTKSPLDAEVSSEGFVNLGDYAGKLTPPNGYDYASLEWECSDPTYSGIRFGANAVVKVDKPCTFTPHWKLLPKVTIATGSGAWRDATSNDVKKQKPAIVSPTLSGGAVNLNDYKDILVVPEDCDPESLYWTIGDSNENVTLQDGIVITSMDNIVYTPHWKTYAQMNKVKLDLGENRTEVVEVNSDGTLNLDSLAERLGMKAPIGYLDGTLYWTASESEKQLKGNVNVNGISILTPHWIANRKDVGEIPLSQQEIEAIDTIPKQVQEHFENMDKGYTVSFISGVKEEVNDVTNLPKNIQGAFINQDYNFPGFKAERSLAEKTVHIMSEATQYPMPKRPGYKLKGVLVEVGTYIQEFGIEAFNIPAQYMTGPLKMIMLWKEEYPVSFVGNDSSEILPSLAYEGENFNFQGFAQEGSALAAGKLTIPKRDGYYFDGVTVEVGGKTIEYDRPTSINGFSIAGDDVTSAIKITCRWRLIPTATISVGNGKWKNTSGDESLRQRNVVVTATQQGALASLKNFTDAFETPEDCDPDSLYFTTDDSDVPVEINAIGEVPIKTNTVYTAHWKTLAESNKVKLVFSQGQSVILDADSNGNIDLNSIVEKYKLTPPQGFTNEAFWTPIGDTKREMSGKINIKSISVSVLSLHWRILRTTSEDNMFSQEDAEQIEQIEVFPEYPVEFNSGVESGSVDNVSSNLDEGFRNFTNLKFEKGREFSFPGFTEGRYAFNILGRVMDATKATIWGSKLKVPTREGFDFDGITVTIGGKIFSYTKEQSMNGFSISGDKVVDTIKITFKWKIQEEKKGLFRHKSAESAKGAAGAAIQIGTFLGTQTAVDTLLAAGTENLAKPMKNIINAFAEFEQLQTNEINQAQQQVSQDNYFKEKSNTEILNQLFTASGLSKAEQTHFSAIISDVELEESGEVMSYENDAQDPSKPGTMHINYKLLRAMFLDVNGVVKNIKLFEVFIKHELKHMEFATSDNALYKVAHKIAFLEEFLVSLSDLYVWNEAQTEGQEYSSILNFIFSNAQILSIAAGISLDDAKKLVTGYCKQIGSASIELLHAVNEKVFGKHIETGVQKPLSLFVSNPIGDNSLTTASEYAKTLGSAESEYATAVIESIPSSVLIPNGYSHRISVNVSFNNLVYTVYVRNIDGICFIGLKSRSGVDSPENFAAAAQFFANDLNTNVVLREELNKFANLGVSSEGVAMMDFIGFPPGATTQKSVEKLYQPRDMTSGLVGVYSVQDLPITPESLTTIQQDIKATELFKLNEPEKFYEIEANLLNLDSIRKAAKIKKKEGATTIILIISDANAENISSSKEMFMKVIEMMHSMDLAVTIQLDISKANEDIFKTFLELGFDGISIDAQSLDIGDIGLIKEVINMLIIVSKNNSISEKNTIHLKNKEMRDALGDLSYSNILTITNIDPETQQATIDEQQALEAIEVGYEIGRNVLKQNVRVEAKNMRALLDIFNRNHADITVNEIRQAMASAGLGPILQKHVESLLKGLENDAKGTNYKVAQAIGFIRGLGVSYTIGMYLDAFNISPEAFSESDFNDRQALGSLLTALFIIDTNNKFFKDTTTLATFFEQAENVFSESSTDDTLSSLKSQMILFANLIVEKFEHEENITDLALSEGNPSQELYTSLAILNDLINKVSFKRIVDQTGKRAKLSASSVKTILGAA
jgi:hypothetical protein